MNCTLKTQTSFVSIRFVISLIFFLALGAVSYLSAENYALKFSANHHIVTIGKPDQALNRWTVEMWVKKNQTTNHATILGGSKYKLNLETWGHSNRVGYTLIGQSSPDRAFNYTLPLFRWTHIAYVYSEGKISLFANGNLIETQNAIVQLPLTSIGMGVEGFVGEIDELRVWKDARTAEELSSNMNRSVNPINETNLLAYWYFDDRAENITDLSAGGYSGTITGATYVVNTNTAFTTHLPEMQLKAINCFHGNEYLVRPGDKQQELLGVKIETQGIMKPLTIKKLKFDFSQSTDAEDIVAAALYGLGQEEDFGKATKIVDAADTSLNLFDAEITLKPGVNYLWLAVDIKLDAKDKNRIDAQLVSATINNRLHQEGNFNPLGNRLITTLITPIPAGNTHNIIPKPMKMIMGEGTFLFNEQTLIVAPQELDKEAEYLAEIFRVSTGYPFTISRLTGDVPNNAIVLNLSETLDATIGKEGYTLNVNAEQVSIMAKTNAGLFWGIQTLRQMLPPQIESKKTIKEQIWSVPEVNIMDNPRFVYRGVMLDVSRHFFPVSTVKKTLDLMAMYKLNVFHWHLTDDQGWRIEIKKYPKLTEIGGWRTCNGVKTGGYYTQEQIKEIVDYATALHIDIVPEIDLPGHMLAGLAAYPELGCTSGAGSYSVTCNRGGIYADILCGGKQQTYTFLEDVLTEVAALFPSKYIHIGGDEAAKGKWNSCTDCQAKINQLGITGANQTEKSNKLQKYMTDHFVTFLAQKGKQLVGWDEITHGGIPKGATIQLWNEANNDTKNAVIQAIKNGQDVIMSNYYKLYLAQRQSDSTEEPPGPAQINTLDEFYTYEPIFPEIPADKIKHVLGAEGCLWTEWVETEKHIEYMLSPRMQALAEMVWTPKEEKNYNNFLERLNAHFERWNVMEYNFRWNEKPQKIAKQITTCSQELELSATQRGVSYFWNDETNSTTRTIKVNSSGTYKCYVNYYGKVVEETYQVEFSDNATLPHLIKTNNKADETVTINVANAAPTIVYRWYKDGTTLKVGESLELPQLAKLNDYYLDASLLANGISSIRLNAPNGYVTLDDGVSLKKANAFSFEAWLKINTWKEWGAIFTHRAGSNAYRLMMELGANGELYCLVANGAVANGKTAMGTIPIGSWVHIAFVFDGKQAGNANRLKLYVNGKAKALTFSGSIPAELPSLNADLRLGRGENNLTPDINIADVRVWKTARTMQEITTNMQGLKDANSADVLCYYPMAMLAVDTDEITDAFTITKKAIPHGLAEGVVTKDFSPSRLWTCNSEKNNITELFTGVDAVKMAEQTPLQILPNPNKGSFRVTLNHPKATAGTLQIVNVNGQTIYQEKFFEPPVNSFIVLKNIKGGVYLVQFTNSGDTQQYACKLLLE